MEKHIDIDILRKEIKRLEKAAHISALGCADSETRKFHEGKDFAYQHVGALIDSLQQEQQEEPSESLEEAAEGYTQKMLESWRFDSTGCRPPRESFKAGAEWQKSQMLKDAFVDSYVVHDGRIELGGNPLPCLNPIILLPYPQFKPDDKVRVIIVKEDSHE